MENNSALILITVVSALGLFALANRTRNKELSTFNAWVAGILALLLFLSVSALLGLGSECTTGQNGTC